MDPVTVSVAIARPPEEVFEYLADIANHSEFTDHYLKDWHLTRVDSYGVGAGARFRVAAPMQRFGWAEAVLTEVEPPYRIVERGHGGKYNRVGTLAVYTLSPGASGGTEVELTVETEPALASDRLMERLGARRWTKRQSGKGLTRLRAILEEDRQRGRRVTIAGR